MSDPNTDQRELEILKKQDAKLAVMDAKIDEVIEQGVEAKVDRMADRVADKVEVFLNKEERAKA